MQVTSPAWFLAVHLYTPSSSGKAPAIVSVFTPLAECIWKYLDGLIAWLL